MCFNEQRATSRTRRSGWSLASERRLSGVVAFRPLAIYILWRCSEPQPQPPAPSTNPNPSALICQPSPLSYFMRILKELPVLSHRTRFSSLAFELSTPRRAVQISKSKSLWGRYTLLSALIFSRVAASNRVLPSTFAKSCILIIFGSGSSQHFMQIFSLLCPIYYNHYYYYHIIFTGSIKLVH